VVVPTGIKLDVGLGLFVCVGLFGVIVVSVILGEVVDVGVRD
jgi:hypothetical protein